MEVTRTTGRESSYDYTLTDNDKILKIIFGGNLDLYWCITNTKTDKTLDTLYDEVYETFLITKENYQIYTLFKKMVDDIKLPRVYEQLEKDESSEEYDNWNTELKTSERYKRLYNGTDIIWHSDDDYYEDADRVKISEVEDDILLEFYRPKQTLDKIGFRRPGTVTIRFRNSGSTYDPFNIVFMKMYQQLQKYNPDYHQMHIEEILYQKTLKKKDK